MTNEIVIRGATPSDLAEITVMAGTPAYWPDEKYREIFRTPRTLLVAERNGALLGFILAHDIVGEWEIENVAVVPGHRRRGIGRMLLDALMAEAANANASVIFLEVRESNVAARNLYESCGFHQYCRRKAYYSAPEEDAILYRFVCSPETRENG